MIKTPYFPASFDGSSTWNETSPVEWHNPDVLGVPIAASNLDEPSPGFIPILGFEICYNIGSAHSNHLSLDHFRSPFPSISFGSFLKPLNEPCFWHIEQPTQEKSAEKTLKLFRAQAEKRERPSPLSSAWPSKGNRKWCSLVLEMMGWFDGFIWFHGGKVRGFTIPKDFRFWWVVETINLYGWFMALL